MRNINNTARKGFTLIELIIVIAVIGILAAAVFVAVDPAKRIGEANNAQRWADVTAIAEAIVTYTVDNSGTLPSGVSGLSSNTPIRIQSIGSGTTGSGTCTATSTTAQADISAGLVATYLPTMPLDPTDGTGSTTAYYINYNSTTGRIKVGACTTYPSNTAVISVQR